MKSYISRKLKQLFDYSAIWSWRKILLVFVCSIFLVVLANFILERTSSRDFLTILPAVKIAIFLLIVIGVVVLIFRKEFSFENHQGLTNLLLVLVTIAFTFSIYFIDKQDSFYDTNTSLVRVNEINTEIAEAIIKKDYSKGYPFIFFLTEPYEENISFISKNFISNNCVTNYYRVMMEMLIVNNITSSITANAVEETSVRQVMNNKASSTIELIQKISSECHPASQ